MSARQWLVAAIACAASVAGAQQWPPPGADQLYGRQQQEAAAEEQAPAEARIPRHVLTQARGWEQALEAQQATGADIFLYISHQRPPSARGLCTWWERRGMRTANVQRLLEHYIRVELNLPAEHATREIADQFHLWEGPTIVIIHPNGQRRSLRVFDRGPSGMQLKSDRQLVELILQNSSAQYRELDL